MEKTSLEAKTMQLITLLCAIPLIAGCRMTKFVKQEEVALENHVIKVITADRPVKCQQDCLDTPLCFSINVHAQTLPSGWVTCDLNNSSQTADPQDLVPKAGYRYHQMAKVTHCTLEQCIYKDALPDGWFIFDSKRLKIFPERKTWGRARNHCQSIGGELVSINSEDKNEFISLLLDMLLTNATAGYNSSQIVAHWTLDGTDSDVNLTNGATYKEEDGVKSLYLNGSGAYATTPAVDFGHSSFTIASWVKLQSPLTQRSPVFSDWSNAEFKFVVNADEYGKLFFGCINNFHQYSPWISAGSSPADTWFHMAAVWDQNANEAYLLLDGRKLGNESQTSGTYLRDNSHTVYDIGLKRDGGNTLKGYLRDLMIIGKAVTSEELGNITDPNIEPFGGAWIGLNDASTEGSFHWSDGSHVTYTKWASSQPDNQNEYENCVEMAFDGDWADTSCGRQLPFICEKDN